MKESAAIPLPKPRALVKGTVHEQYVRCGKMNCRCRKGKPHGPYHYLFWRERGRLRKLYLRRDEVDEVRAACTARQAQQRSLREAWRRVSSNTKTPQGIAIAMKQMTTRPLPDESSGEATALAHKLAGARRQLVEEYERHRGLSRDDAIAEVRQFDNHQFAEQILLQPRRSTTWHNLDTLAAVDPELAVQRWNDVVDDAVEELASGHRAAAVVDVDGSSCWSRAQFLALREQLADNWAPRSGIEIALIDAMAQSLTLKMTWMGRLVALDSLENPEIAYANVDPLPRVDIFRTVEQAAGMIDRFDRMFMRALRQLRDLRRYTVVVQHAGQVNVGEQQVNLGGSRVAKSDEVAL